MKHLLLFEAFVANTLRPNHSKLNFGDDFPELDYETWEDPDVAYWDCNVSGTEEETKKFALLVDKIGELFSVPEPLITSGIRGAESQLNAMLSLWKNNGSDYVKSLYSNCKTCTPEAKEVSRTLVDLWDKDKEETGFAKQARAILGKDISDDVYQKSMAILKETPISMHQFGNALDYGTNSNRKEDIKTILDFLIKNNFAEIDLIDETVGKPPHWHISVLKVTPEGEEFLETPNEEIVSKGLFNYKKPQGSEFQSSYSDYLADNPGWEAAFR